MEFHSKGGGGTGPQGPIPQQKSNLDSWTDIGESINARSRGFIRVRQGVMHQRFRIAANLNLSVTVQQKIPAKKQSCHQKRVIVPAAQEWINRTLISHEPLLCSKTCFSKTESGQMVQYFSPPFFFNFNLGLYETKMYVLNNLSKEG